MGFFKYLIDIGSKQKLCARAKAEIIEFQTKY